MKRLLFVFIMLVCCIACKKEDDNLDRKTAVGTIKDAGSTYYMYGTHILATDDGKTLYALTSSTVDLKDYNNTKVEVTGVLVKNYPIEDVSEFLDVNSVKVYR
ncbi:hypothetical protein [uncultured Acetobacteroides sp.]|uniref:hypothetical protein n=1 Tax=uncultured Acetobacteroides sp. TaxID=1760811 RepID=UPI0029F4C1F3|nr:hypothetical protein [uncultured Acetobacteroides sp.]